MSDEPPDVDFGVEYSDESGERHSVTLHIRPVPELYAAIYRRRGMEIPEGHSGHAPGALVPYRWRAWHRRYAEAHGFYWLPCVLCNEPHGGHEIVDTIPDPTKGEGWGIAICPACTARRNGGKP